MSRDYVPRHYSGLLAGASARARATVDYRRAMQVVEGGTTAAALLLAVVLSAWRASQIRPSLVSSVQAVA